MPIYDYECHLCSYTWEVIEGTKERVRCCPSCGDRATRIISASGQYCANEDADWIKSVVEVVDKGDSATAMDRRFAKNPTRANYKRWMKSRGLRPYEPGERTKPPPPDDSAIRRKVLERHMARNRIEI